MKIDLSLEDLEKANDYVASGRFTSVSEAIHAGLEAIEESPEWKEYAQDRITAGLADIEAGRTKSADEIHAMLQTYSLKKA